MRTFKTDATYLSRAVNFDTGNEEEIIFYVLKPSGKHWNTWSHPPVQYWAIDLCDGILFEFHRDSIIAENAKELE